MPKHEHSQFAFGYRYFVESTSVAKLNEPTKSLQLLLVKCSTCITYTQNQNNSVRSIVMVKPNVSLPWFGTISINEVISEEIRSANRQIHNDEKLLIEWRHNRSTKPWIRSST